MKEDDANGQINPYVLENNTIKHDKKYKKTTNEKTYNSLQNISSKAKN